MAAVQAHLQALKKGPGPGGAKAGGGVPPPAAATAAKARRSSGGAVGGGGGSGPVVVSPADEAAAVSIVRYVSSAKPDAATAQAQLSEAWRLVSGGRVVISHQCLGQHILLCYRTYFNQI